MIVLALSSGTSADAVDVAAARFTQSGDLLVLEPLGFAERAWPEGLHDRIVRLYPPATTSIGEVTELTTLLGQAFAAAARHGIDAFGEPDLIVSHGQTVFHWVERGHARGTLQLGEPAWIAEATGVTVLSNLRMRDIAAGGHGAPLASTLDALWLGGIAEQTRSERVASVNLGGIANVSLWNDGRMASYDTGPGNCLIDDAVSASTVGAQTYDEGGVRAARGSVDEELLARLLADPYFGQAPPKSTGREYFTGGFVRDRAGDAADLPVDDLVATLTELTARTVADQVASAEVLVASGGGVRNPALMAALRRRIGRTRLASSAEFGIDPAAKEAYLFALLGYLGATGQPGTVAVAGDGVTTTGASGPRILGDFTPGRGPLVLPPPAPPVRRLDFRPPP